MLKEFTITVRDGTSIAAAVYAPEEGGRFPALLAAAPYRYDVLEWIAKQPWSNGKVGGLGQIYFCMSQWWMGIMAPPSLACLGAYDELNDSYRASCY